MDWIDMDRPAMAEELCRQVPLAGRRLDEVRPDWWKVVQIERLDFLSDRDCLIGQMFGDFRGGCEQLGKAAELPFDFALVFCPHQQAGITNETMRKIWAGQIWLRRRGLTHQDQSLAAEGLAVAQRPVVRGRIESAIRSGVLVLTAIIGGLVA